MNCTILQQYDIIKCCGCRHKVKFIQSEMNVSGIVKYCYFDPRSANVLQFIKFKSRAAVCIFVDP